MLKTLAGISEIISAVKVLLGEVCPKTILAQGSRSRPLGQCHHSSSTVGIALANRSRFLQVEAEPLTILANLRKKQILSINFGKIAGFQLASERW